VTRNPGIELLCIAADTTLRAALAQQSSAIEHGMPSGMLLVVDADRRLLGTITDGDMRRALLREGSLDAPAGGAMMQDPITFRDGMSYRQILAALPAELERRGRRDRRFLGKILIVDAEKRPLRVLDYHQLWEQRVATHRHIVVVGLGYVGLTLGLELAREGFQVTGVDVDAARVAAIRGGDAHVHEQGLAELLREQLRVNFQVSTDLPPGGDVFVVAVGTPVATTPGTAMPTPQLGHLEAAIDAVGARLKRGGLVVLRSTVPVGTTREVVRPRLERLSGLVAGVDFHLAFAPERTAEGQALQELRILPQVIGGINEDSVEATAALFRELTPTIVRVESVEAAEMVKLLNNGFRDLVFAFANQVAQVGARFNLDLVELIRAANRGYPRDQIPLPSPGVGGACLTKDPYILASVATRAGIPQTLFELGRRVNESMHDFVVDALLQQLSAVGKDPARARVLLCGLAFKGNPETGDLRNSSALEIAALLRGRVGELLGHDPVAPADAIAAAGLTPVALPAGAAGVDAILLLNNHRSYQKVDIYSLVRSLAPPPIVYDGWHLWSPEDVLRAAPGVYLGLGFVRSSR